MLARPESQLAFGPVGVVVGHEDGSCVMQFTSDEEGLVSCLKAEDELVGDEDVEQSFSKVTRHGGRARILRLSINKEGQDVGQRDSG